MTRECLHRNQHLERRSKRDINDCLQRRAISSVLETKVGSNFRNFLRVGNVNHSHYSLLSTPLLVKPKPEILKQENTDSVCQTNQVNSDCQLSTATVMSPTTDHLSRLGTTCYSGHMLQRAIKEPKKALNFEWISNSCSYTSRTENGSLAEDLPNSSPTEKTATSNVLQRMEVKQEEIPELNDEQIYGLTEIDKSFPGLMMQAKVLIISEAFQPKERLSENKFKDRVDIAEVHRTIYVEDINEWDKKQANKMKQDEKFKTYEWNWIDKEGPWIEGGYDIIIARSMICACDLKAHSNFSGSKEKVEITSTCGGINKDNRLPVLMKVAQLLSKNKGARAILTNSPTKEGEQEILHPKGFGYWEEQIKEFNKKMPDFLARVVKNEKTFKDWYLGFYGIEISRKL